MTARRTPDFIVGGAADPYLLRWWLIPRNRWLNVYLHHFLRSDDDRALHDHPWWNVSVILKGAYVEHTTAGAQRYAAGDVKARLGKTAHRIELTDGPCWTLFITGPRFREWGFHCPNGWRHWGDFTSPINKGEVGRGCE
jgi:hypothetical protein